MSQHACKSHLGRLGPAGPLLALLAALLVPAGPTLAAEPAAESANMDLARSVAVTGREAFNAGDYETAVALFRRAYTLYPAPTVVLYEARSLEKLGSYIEAVEAYTRTTRIPMDAEAPAQFAEAIAAAHQEGRALKARIPSLTLRVEGVSANDPNLEVSINGSAVGAAQLGQAQSLNPGTYRIRGGVSSERADQKEVELGPGENVTVVLDLSAPSLSPPPPAAAHNPGGSEEFASDSPRSFSTWTYVAAGVGIAGLGTGLATGLMASAKHADAKAACPASLCEKGTEGPGLADDFRSLRTVSTIGYSVGAAGIGVAAVLWLTASEPDTSSARAIEPWVSGDCAGLRGHF